MLGSYKTQDEVIKAIDVYQLGGHEASNIVILTNEANVESLEEKTSNQITIKTNTQTNENEGEEDQSMFEKIKETMSPTDDFEIDTVEKLIAYGLTPEEAERSIKEVENGHIVVLADDELRMGHDENNPILDEGTKHSF